MFLRKRNSQNVSAGVNSLPRAGSTEAYWNVRTREIRARKGKNGMDLNQDVWDRLREQGHTIGTPYAQAGVLGLFVVVDEVAMSLKDARALAHGRRTLSGIKEQLGVH